jgi:hypothetical protein
MYERDENGNIKVDENGNYKVSEAGMAAYRQKAASRSLATTLNVSTATLRQRVDTSRNALRAAQAKARGNNAALGQYFAAAKKNNGGSGMPPLIRHYGDKIRRAAQEGDVEFLMWARDLAQRGSAVYLRAAEKDYWRIRVRDWR